MHQLNDAWLIENSTHSEFVVRLKEFLQNLIKKVWKYLSTSLSMACPIISVIIFVPSDARYAVKIGNGTHKFF